MDRMLEYQSLMTQLEQTPPELEFTITRARARARRRNRRFLGVPAASIAGIFAAFVLLVNTSAPFARACASIPFLRELAEAVSFSPSLSSAVEHDHVQPVGQSQTINGVTLKLNYLIVDQKQLNLFYTVTCEDNAVVQAVLDCQVTSPGLTDYSIYYGSAASVGQLDYFTLDFAQGDMPSQLDLVLSVLTLTDSQASYDLSAQPSAQFSFHLEFDPTLTVQGETYSLNQTLTLDDQKICLDQLELYPTHARLVFHGGEGNDWLLTGLSFYLEDGDGIRYLPEGGLAGRGDGLNGGQLERRTASPWFSKSNSLTLFVTGASWLDEAHSTVQVDLAAGTAQGLPQGFVFSGARRDDGSPEDLVLMFQGPPVPKGEAVRIPFRYQYLDPHGQLGSITSGGAGTGSDDSASYHLILEDYSYDTVTLLLHETNRSLPDTPLEFSVK